MKYFKGQKYRDEDLWEVYVEDFDGFNEVLFQKVDRDLIRQLRDHLRAHGVFVSKQTRSSIANALTTTLMEESPATWTPEEVAKQVASTSGMISIRNRVAEPLSGQLAPEGRSATSESQAQGSQDLQTPDRSKAPPLAPESSMTIPSGYAKEMKLQMAVKAINDSAGPNET